LDNCDFQKRKINLQNHHQQGLNYNLLNHMVKEKNKKEKTKDMPPHRCL
jgi:hypothetical protein